MDCPCLQQNSDREKILNHHALQRQSELLGMGSSRRPLAQRISSAITSRVVANPVARYDHSRLELIVYLLAGLQVQRADPLR